MKAALITAATGIFVGGVLMGILIQIVMRPQVGDLKGFTRTTIMQHQCLCDWNHFQEEKECKP